jgi:acetyl-CoA synthetase
VVHTQPEDEALIHFTSGTTGRPKGAVHVHKAVVNHASTGRYALELKPGTVYWCTADPGWVTGTSYGIIAPLVHRATLIIDEAEFDLERWYATLEREKVEVWYTAPTAIRMMMRAGKDAARGYDFSSLRFLASVGEPLNPEAVVWGNEVFGQPFHDNWWQTETGGIMIANTLDMDIKPGSMGMPLPGIEAAVVNREGWRRHTVQPGEIGDLALKVGWPSMMRAYLHEQARYAKTFAGDWYISGDLAMQDQDGYFWFVGRADDLIKSSGHLIGPFEVESALIEHEAVAEAGVIGCPTRPPARWSRPMSRSIPASSPPRSSRNRSAAMPARSSARRWPRAPSSSARPCRRHDRARSCAACSRRANWACPKATFPRWRRTSHDQVPKRPT